MSLITVCTKCGCEIQTPKKLAGKELLCPRCDAVVRAPDASDEEPPVVTEVIESDASQEGIVAKPAAPSAAGLEERQRPAARRRDSDRDDDDDRPSRRSRRGDRLDDDTGDEEEGDALIPWKNGRALAAYYTGVFALIPGLGLILGPLALVLGILGYKYANAHPKAKGGVHAVVGIVLGILTILGNWGTLIVFLVVWGISSARAANETRQAEERRNEAIARAKAGLPEPGLPPGFDPKGDPAAPAVRREELNEPLFSRNRDLLFPDQPLNLPAEDGLVAAVRVSDLQVSRLLFAPDGKTLAVEASNGSRLIEVTSSKVRELPGRQPLAYTHDSRFLAVQSKFGPANTIELINPEKVQKEGGGGARPRRPMRDRAIFTGRQVFRGSGSRGQPVQRRPLGLQCLDGIAEETLRPWTGGDTYLPRLCR